MAASGRGTYAEKVFLFLCLFHLSLSTQSVSKLWVVYDAKGENFKVQDTEPADFIAVATYKDTINENGWANLDIVTTSGRDHTYTDAQQSYAAGFVEGHITRPIMKNHWINTIAGTCPEPLSDFCHQLKKFLEENLQWVLKNIDAQAKTDPYWHHVNLYLLQIAGLQDGYSDYPGVINTNIDVLGVYLWQVDGDMEDLGGLFPNAKKPDQMLGSGRCSALIRLLPDFSDLYVSQVTWNELNSMLRILKKYSFELHMLPDTDIPIPGHTMTFSSYPGTLSSGDDFYAISSGLLTQETTIGNSNAALTVYITPKSVLEATRSMVANRLASNGFEWSQVFSQYNSGTYNNQWMIINYRLFEPKKATPIPGLFYLLEQIPGTIEYRDITEVLYKQNYYGSYNVAYFPDIFNKSGMPALVEKYGDWFTYDKTPRALIFKRDVPKVLNVDAMTKLMRYNNYKNDPLSRCNCTPPYSAENAISCRDDLNPANGTYPFSSLGHRPHIGTDMKLMTYGLFKSLSFYAIGGPTYDDVPAFRWSTSDYNHLSHVGHPDLWKFDRIIFNGTTPIPNA